MSKQYHTPAALEEAMLVAVQTTLADRGNAIDHPGKQYIIIDPNYTIKGYSDGVKWVSQGNGPLANRPSAADFGKGIWHDTDTNIIYKTDGSTWFAGIVVSSVEVREATIDGHALIRTVTSDTATRIHQEPNGHPVGTSSKYDFMIDPYDSVLGGDSTNYRIGNLVAKTHDPSDIGTQQGSSGVFLISAKSAGQSWGCWPSIQMGFQDGSTTSATPFKMMYFDTADTIWYTPMLGAWRTGMVVAIDDYVTYNNKIYKATSAGTTGATGPSHTSGTVSDGTVDWLWIRTPSSGNIKGCVVIGDLESKPKFGFPGVRLQMAKDALLQNGIGLLLEDQTGAQSWKLYNPTTAGSSDLRIEAEAAKYLRLSKSASFVSQVGLGRVLALTTDSSGTATPSVVGVEKLNLTPAAPISVTSFAGRVSNQVFYVEGTSNVTLVEGATLKLKAGVNYTFTGGEQLCFVCGSTTNTAWQI